MTTFGAANTAMSNARVTVGGIRGWADILTVDDFPTPDSATGYLGYYFVVTFHVGNFATGTPNGTAEVALWDDQGAWFVDTTHVINLSDQNLAQGTDRGFGVMMMLWQPSWPTSRKLRVRARYNNVNPLLSGSFEIEGLSVLTFDLTALGSSRYFASQYTGTASNTLPHAPSVADMHQTTAAIPWTSGTERWLVFFATRVAPGSNAHAYSTWMVEQPAGTWASSTNGWGSNVATTFNNFPIVHGAAGRVTNLDPTRNNFWQGLCRDIEVTNATTKIGIRGSSLYNATAGTASQWTEALIFGYRLDDDTGYVSDTNVEAPEFYGTTANWGINTLAATYAGPLNLTIISMGVPVLNALPGRSYASDVRQNAAFIKAGNDPLYTYQRLLSEGVGEYRMASVAGFAGYNYPEMRGTRNPRDVIKLQVTGVTFTAGISSGAYDLTTATPHGVPLLSFVYVTVAGFVPSNPADPNIDGFYLGVVRSGNTLQIVVPQVTATAFATLGTVEPGSPTGMRAFSIIVALSLTDDLLGAIPAQVPGPEVQLSVNAESDPLGSLTALPVEPSLPITCELLLDKTDLGNRAYSITWPTYLEPRRLISVVWSGLTRTERDSLRTFLDNLATTGIAFKWTMPDDAERAYVLADFAVEETDQGADIWGAKASMVQLVYLA